MNQNSRFSLEGKVALITGASAAVALTSRKQEDLDKVAEEIRAAGGNALPVAAHAGKIDEIKKLVDRVAAEYGGIDILVNNAGGVPATALCLDVEERLWETVMNLNLKGVFFLSQAAAHLMKARGGGKIINVSSTSAFQPEYQNGVYSMAKAAVAMMTKSMALELAEFNIRVNAIAPGPILTKLLSNTWSGLPQEHSKMVQDYLAGSTPIGRIGDPDEISGAMLYLASDASSYTTGETIIIDGGMLLGHKVERK